VSVKLRKDGKAWWVFICFHGRRKAKKVGSRAAAERVKREIEARLALGDFGVLEQKAKITFADYGKKWLELHAKAHCKTSTFERYEQVFRIYLAPRFGSCPVDRIERDDLKRFFSELATSKRHGLGTLRNIVATLRAILSEALSATHVNVTSTSSLATRQLTFSRLLERTRRFASRCSLQPFGLACDWES
jgi:hypothetical protein